MHTDTNKYNKAQTPGDRAICDALAAEIDRALPDAENKVWHAHPVWFLDGNPIAGYSKLKGCIRLLFWSGQSFKAKGLKPEGTFKAAEARYTSADEIDTKALRRWLAEARDVQWDYKNIVKRRGKLERIRKPRTRPAPKSTKKAAQPKLLSGGNPQIPKADGDAPVQAYIAAMPDWKQEAGRRLDALIERTVPDVRKAVRWNSPFYGVEGRGWFLSYHCFTKYIKVTFLNGARLKPLPPVGSKDPNTRYLHIHDDEEIDEPRLVRWIKQAAKLPGERLF